MSLTQPPSNVTPEAWLSHAGDGVSVGQLWLLSWNGEALALGVIAGVTDTFVLVWPATPPSEPSFPPALTAPSSPLGIEISVWPTRETGVGRHLLHRNFGALLLPAAVRAVEKALEGGGPLPLDWATPNIGTTELESASDAMVDRWEAICLNVWPEPRVGFSPLDSGALRSLDIEVGDISRLLNVGTSDAVILYSGEAVPTDQQLRFIADWADVDPSALLATGGDEATTALLSPSVKDDLLAIATTYGVSEAEARALVQREFALAARSDGTVLARLDAAIHRTLIGRASR